MFPDQTMASLLPDTLDLDIPITFNLQGAKLAALTQAITYHVIMEHQPQPTQPTTSRNLQVTREAIQNYNGLLEIDTMIWAGMKQCTLQTCTKQFVYKAMHGTQKVGEYWRHLGDSAPREFCSVCRTTESMEHILTRCQATPPRLIWTLAKDLWPHDQIPWPEISLGIILGSGTITLPPAEPQKT